MSDHINIGFVWDRPTLSNMIIMFLHSYNKSVVNSECGQRTIFKLITLQLNNKNRSMVHGLVGYFILFELSWKYSYLQFGRSMVYKYQPKLGARHRISKPLDDGQNGGNSCQYDNGLLNMIQSSQKIQYWLIDRFKLFSHWLEFPECS